MEKQTNKKNLILAFLPMPFYFCETDHVSITMSTTVVLMNIGINLLF